MVRAKVVGDVGKELSLFTPSSLGDGLSMEDGTVELEEGRSVVLVVQNHGTGPVHLEKGRMLGEVAELIEGSAEPRNAPEGEPEGDNGSATVPAFEVPVCSLTVRNDLVGREEQLLDQLSLQVDHLHPEQQQQLRDLIISYSDVFALNASELGTTTLVTHTIDTGDSRPVKQPVRRTPFALRSKVDELVQDMLYQGVVEPSKSPWASPVVLVRKKDGSVQFCVDYRKLNQVTKLDEFPLPRIDDTLDQLAGSEFFTTLDLASGYWQVEMDSTAQEKTAFTTYSGLYEFKKMPFGLANAPATFQRLMENVLAGLARKSCLDDVLVMGGAWEEQMRNLREVLDRLRAAGLRLKPKKCSFAQLEVEYLGHIVSATGVRTDPKKLKAVNKFPAPTNVKTLRSFVGLASYYRRFIPNFSKIAGPLHSLTRKDVEFLWTPPCQSAFERLKQLLISAPLLAFPRFERPFLLETDASGAGLGAVLAQRQEDGSVRRKQNSPEPREELWHHGVGRPWCGVGGETLSPLLVWSSLRSVYGP